MDTPEAAERIAPASLRDTPETERIAPASVLGGIAFCSPESPARAPRALPAMGSPSSPAKQGPASAHGSICIALVARLLPDSLAGKPPAKRLAALGPRPPTCRNEILRLVQHQQQLREFKFPTTGPHSRTRQERAKCLARAA
jgi:hypothetical protein